MAFYITGKLSSAAFWCFVMLQGDPQSQDPVVYDNGVTYMFIQHSNVYLMIAARQNCNAASLLFFLHRIVDVSIASNYGSKSFRTLEFIQTITMTPSNYTVLLRQVFKHYFEELEEESLRDNFVVVVRCRGTF